MKSDPLLERFPTHEGYKVIGGIALYKKLGQGGMGAVYKGRHVRLNTDVALKIMASPAGIGGAAAEKSVQRFIREAQISAAIDHPNLIRTIDVNSESGVYYLAMQYMQGESAQERLERCTQLSESEAVGIALDAARGLAAAHKKGIVHRDIKPDNIMIDTEGNVKVADLGLAKAIDQSGEDAAPTITQTQQAIGTPSYYAS